MVNKIGTIKHIKQKRFVCRGKSPFNIDNFNFNVNNTLKNVGHSEIKVFFY